VRKIPSLKTKCTFYEYACFNLFSGDKKLSGVVKLANFTALGVLCC